MNATKKINWKFVPVPAFAVEHMDGDCLKLFTLIIKKLNYTKTQLLDEIPVNINILKEECGWSWRKTECVINGLVASGLVTFKKGEKRNDSLIGINWLLLKEYERQTTMSYVTPKKEKNITPSSPTIEVIEEVVTQDIPAIKPSSAKVEIVEVEDEDDLTNKSIEWWEEQLKAINNKSNKTKTENYEIASPIAGLPS